MNTSSAPIAAMTTATVARMLFRAMVASPSERVVPGNCRYRQRVTRSCPIECLWT
jgi:hypothetical protein